jgi:hypothetical protein
VAHDYIVIGEIPFLNRSREKEGKEREKEREREEREKGKPGDEENLVVN